MSDFDKYFAERLDEEGNFPQRDKNWKALSKRLDAFDAGVHGYSSRMRYWQAAAAVSVMAVSLLFGKVYQMQQENARLRGQIASLHDKYITPGIYLNAAATPLQESETPAPAIISPDTASVITPQAGFADPERRDNNTTAITRRRHDIPARPRQNPGNAAAMFNRPEESGSNLEMSPEIQDDADLNNQKPMAPDRQYGAVELEEIAKPVGRMPVFTPLPVHIFVPGHMTDSTTQIKTASVNTPFIKPTRHYFSKFRVGVQSGLGLPVVKEKGISPLSGAGFTAQYTVLPNLRLQASADWMYHEINADTFLSRQHFPHTPPKPKFGYKLTQVEGNQRSQYYSLGIAYSIPLRIPVKPAVRIAHTWAHWAPSFYNLTYERKWVFIPFNPKQDYEPKKSEPEWTKNNWRIGAGLEYESPRWVVGVWADYSRNFSSRQTSFDILFLRAGMEYKFD